MLIIFTLSILLYVNTWDFGFASDDTMMITQNEFTKGGSEGLKKILTTDAFAGYLGEGKSLLSGGRYRPLSQWIFNLQYSAHGLSPKLWHIQNTLFFAFSMLLLYITLLKIFRRSNPQWTSLAFITTLIALSHPLNTEVVANIKSFDLLLSLVFSLAALFWSLSWYDTHKPIYLLGVFISLFLGILAKETALTFLGIIPLTILFFRAIGKMEFSVLMTVVVASIASYFVFRIQMIGLPESIEVAELLNNPFVAASDSEKYATILFTWWHYIQLYILPVSLTHDYYPYTIELTNWSNPLVILSAAFYIIMTIWSLYQLYLTVFKRKLNSFVAYGWLFYIFVFSISSNIFVSIGAFMNERFIFIANIGLALIFAHFILLFSKRFLHNTPAILYLFTIPLVIIFGLKTFDRNYAWEDDYTLFTTDVLVSHNSAKCNVSAGGKTYEKAKTEYNPLQKAKMLDDAEQFLKKGIQIHPKYVQAYILLGNVYFEKENYNMAFKSYIQSIRLGERRDAPSNIKSLGLKLHNIKEYKSSLDVFQYYEGEFKPESDVVYYIADNYLNLNNLDTAIIILNNLIKQDSTYDEAYNKLGEIYGKYKNNFSASEYYLFKAYEINPKNASVCENLGVLHGIRGNAEQSIYFFEKALNNMKSPNAQIHQNIANSYLALGDKAKAAQYFEKAKMVQSNK